MKYWVNGDETTINLVMEDLTGTTTPGNQITGCGPAEAEAVVVELARLHSEFFPLTDATAPAWMIRLPRCASTGRPRQRAGQQQHWNGSRGICRRSPST